MTQKERKELTNARKLRRAVNKLLKDIEVNYCDFCGVFDLNGYDDGEDCNPITIRDAKSLIKAYHSRSTR